MLLQRGQKFSVPLSTPTLQIEVLKGANKLIVIYVVTGGIANCCSEKSTVSTIKESFNSQLG